MQNHEIQGLAQVGQFFRRVVDRLEMIPDAVRTVAAVARGVFQQNPLFAAPIPPPQVFPGPDQE